MFPQALTLNQHRYYVPFLIFHTSRFRMPLFYLRIFIMQFVFSPFPHYQRLNAFFPSSLILLLFVVIRHSSLLQLQHMFAGNFQQTKQTSITYNQYDNQNTFPVIFALIYDQHTFTLNFQVLLRSRYSNLTQLRPRKTRNYGTCTRQMAESTRTRYRS